MKEKKSMWALMVADIFCCIAAMYLAAWLKFDGVIAAHVKQALPEFYAIAVVSVLFISLLLGNYKSIWYYIGIPEIGHQLLAVFFSGVVFLIVKYTGLHFVSGSITIIYCGILFLLTTFVRCIPRLIGWLGGMAQLRSGQSKRVIIIGAGATGAMLIKRLGESAQDGMYPIAAVDDDLAKQGTRIAGVRVCGTINDVAHLAQEKHADELIIAIPSATEEQRSEIFQKCLEAHLPVRLFQSMIDMENYLAGDRKALKEVSIEDLLFRDSVKTDMTPVYAFLKGKTVLVTGGAGSIGSEICRQVLEHGCEKLIIFDIHENGMFALNEELKQRFDRSRYELCMGSVREKHRLEEVFAEWKPEIVFHAAAHKHVPMMEINPAEAVKNNVGGTLHVLQCCADHGVKRFVLISTDKAVNPTNVMGATKRLAELMVQMMNGRGGCEMAAVRFGNVLGSNGSVIPLFKKQIAEGGPVTVTHKDMRRYFMTIPEAVSLVLSAGVLAHGGELFVLDMGKPIRIYDLAETLVRLSGLEPGRDIEIKITGLRPGEKLFEELALDSESVDKTSHQKIFIVHTHRTDHARLAQRIDTLLQTAAGQEDSPELRQQLFEAIGEGE